MVKVQRTVMQQRGFKLSLRQSSTPNIAGLFVCKRGVNNYQALSRMKGFERSKIVTYRQNADKKILFLREMTTENI